MMRCRCRRAGQPVQHAYTVTSTKHSHNTRSLTPAITKQPVHMYTKQIQCSTKPLTKNEGILQVHQKGKKKRSVSIKKEILTVN